MSQPPKPLNPSRHEIACYVADMLVSLKRLSGACDMPLLVHLIDLAHLEAARNAQSRGDEASGDGETDSASLDGRSTATARLRQH
jgi:hypothetical protein